MWHKWNSESVEERFVTKKFSSKQIYSIITFLVVLFIGEWAISYFLVGNDFLNSIVDVLGGASFLIGTILVALGNFWGFAFFLMSDSIWVATAFMDMLNSDNGLMIMMGISMFFQSLTYSILAITGFIQWRLERAIIKEKTGITTSEILNIN